MNKTWILVAHRGGARLFEHRGPKTGLELLKKLDNPAGKLKNHEIDSDRPGRSFDSRGAGRHAYAKEQEATAHVAEQFAKQLALVLDEGRVQQRFTHVVLVAEPRFLGNLRAALHPQTAALVSASIAKDLASLEDRDLPKHLNGVIRI